MLQQIIPASAYFTASDGVRIHYRTTPGKKTQTWTILLHGLGGDSSVWGQIQSLLYHNGHPSIAIDFRGHGLSEAPQATVAYVLARLSQDVVEIAASLHLKQVILVGHCFGGMVAIQTAHEKKILLKSLVLVETHYKSSFLGLPSQIPKQLAKVIRAMAYAFPRRAPRTRDSFAQFVDSNDFDFSRFVSDVRATSIRSYLLSCSQAFCFDASEMVSSIVVPTLVIGGENDAIFPPKVMKDLADRIHNSDLITIPKANHIVVISKPLDLGDVLVKYAETIY